MVRKVVGVKNHILRAKAKEIIKFDKKLEELVKDMQDTLSIQKDPEGVGLAAPQIGKSVRLFVVSYKKLKRTIINPVVLEMSKIVKKRKPHYAKATRGKKEDILEGCLSLPHYYGPIKRNQKLKIKYKNEKGEEKVEEFVGFEAQIMQHEIDHLNGKLFIDHILEQKAPLYQFGIDGWEEVELV
jgi:peptide deformylase